MKYQEFLDYIYQRHSGNVKLGLDRMLNILQAMGNPNKELSGIHIAGTNGKGSTCAMCEAMSLEFGLETGMNTSPHLVDYRERIRLNGKNIKLAELISLYKKWEDVLEENEASFFEITTAIAFAAFQQNKIENAIFEVGLGGRLDGTNPFASTVTTITSISYDHTKSLGDTIEKIAFEKAGIIKENTPLVLGHLPKEAFAVIQEVSQEKHAPIIKFGEDFKISKVIISEKGTSFDYISNDLKLTNISTNLLGKHQAYNAAVAVTAFVEFLKKTGRKIEIQKIKKALQNVNWQGRMQIISQKPTVIIDGAHNVEGVKALTNNLKEIFPNKRILFVLAILRDKKLSEIIKDICSVSYKVYVSKNKSTRAAEIEDQIEIVKKHHTNYETVLDVVEAVKKALTEANEDDIVMISGSLYTISEVIKEKDKIFS
ncbi:MAG: bifunctional tetrahydrofolate synthase/dihydrofolate synthase [Candidatus Cloacimonadota bacterium]|nr:MAG: bifunctional tetrahydrofolate synthase/dihydrofolate synthase [Candidatus Cloacimonadota bacterium]